LALVTWFLALVCKPTFVSDATDSLNYNIEPFRRANRRKLDGIIVDPLMYASPARISNSTMVCFGYYVDDTSVFFAAIRIPDDIEQYKTRTPKAHQATFLRMA
jgi:hypothetical protein